MGDFMDSEEAAVKLNSSVDDDQCFVPECANDMKPYVGQKFRSLEEGTTFYKAYAEACGFDIRMGTTKKSVDRSTIIWRYLLCSREGEKNTKYDLVERVDMVNSKRRRVSMRCSCLARLTLKFVGIEGYVVDAFVEVHNHTLLHSSYKPFLSANRKVGYMQQKFFLDCYRANVGLMKSYKLMKAVVGGYANIGCSSVDVKNMSRDLKAFVVDVDAQIILDKLHKKKELCAAFYFEYSVDAEDRLTRIFWADPISRRNYHVFGDVVSFDGTYSTNKFDNINAGCYKYNMIFAPFTGKDNHGKIVTFAAGLLTREDVESYEWILDNFKRCMVHSPSMIVTDQDPALRIAVDHVFPNIRHRFCMWHIMRKVLDKMSEYLDYDDKFLKKFSCIVWCEFIDINEFEKKWNDLMAEYCLGEDDWFKSMFTIRDQWLPAFHRDFPMGGLIRTTSISESVNSFFGKYTRKQANLIEFFMHFDNAIEAQRHANAHLNCVDESHKSYFLTSLVIEKHAASIYTSKIFKKVQKELLAACFECSILNISRGEEVHNYEIVDGNKHICRVNYNMVEDNVECSCKMFMRVGLICCHIFFLFKNLNMTEIPKKYIVARWTRGALVNPIHSYDGMAGNEFVADDENNLLMSKIVSEFYKCLGFVDGNTEQMSKLLNYVMDLRKTYDSGDDTLFSSANKKSLFERFIGSTLPAEVSIRPPNPVKTKGSGSRIKSRKEKAIMVANKPKRKCSKCQRMTNHDARNCPYDTDDNAAPSN